MATNKSTPPSRKDRNISADLSPDTKKGMRELAKRSKMKLTDYVRALCDEAVAQEVTFKITYVVEKKEDPPS